MPTFNLSLYQSTLCNVDIKLIKSDKCTSYSCEYFDGFHEDMKGFRE